MSVQGGKCAEHQRKAWANASQHKLQMDSAREKRWRSQVRLNAGGKCQMCGEQGAEADHITEIADGGALYDPANGQWLCVSCHERKSKLAKRARARRRRARRDG